MFSFVSFKLLCWLNFSILLHWFSPHLIPHTVPAAEPQSRIILQLSLQDLSVIVLPPEPPLPVAGLQGVLSLVEVGGGGVGIEGGT